MSFSVLMMMRIWDSHGERFYHTPSDSFWELKLNKQLMRNWRHFFSHILSNILICYFLLAVYELQDFWCALSNIWLEFESHHPPKRILHDDNCWWYFPRASLKLATWICEGSVWSILLEHSSGIKLVRHLLNFGYWSCKFWQLCYYEISYEENGDIVFWIPMFDEFLCLEVNPSGFDSKKHWIWYSVDDDAIISCCNWAGLYPNANEVLISWFAKAKRKWSQMTCFVYIQIILELWISHKVIGSEIITVEGVQELTI